MSTAPIRIPITADDQYSAALSTAQAKVRAFGVASGTAGDTMTHSFHEAKGAAALLGEEVGINLNRHLRSVLASSQLIGPLLEAAFPVVAAIGFIEVLEHIPDVIKNAADSIGGFTEKLKAAEQEAIKNNERLLLSFKDISKGYLILQELQKNQVAASNEANTKGIFTDIGKGYAAAGVIGIYLKIKENIEERNKLIDKSLDLQDLETKVLERQNVLWDEKKKKAIEYAKSVEEAGRKLDTTRFLAFQQSQKVDPSISSIGNVRFASADDLINQAPSEAIADRYLARFKALQAVYLATRTPAETLAIEIERLNTLFGDNKGEIYQRAIEGLKDKYDEARVAVRRFGEDAGEALKQGILMGRSWRDVLESLVVSISQLIVKMYVLKALQASSFGSSGFGSFLSSLLSGFTGGHASGGYMAPGTWGIAGENGPEPIYAGMTGMSIFPNRSLSGGGSTVYNIDARGAQMGVEREIIRAIQASENRAVARSVATIRENGFRGRG